MYVFSKNFTQFDQNVPEKEHLFKWEKQQNCSNFMEGGEGKEG